MLLEESVLEIILCVAANLNSNCCSEFSLHVYMHIVCRTDEPFSVSYAMCTMEETFVTRSGFVLPSGYNMICLAYERLSLLQTLYHRVPIFNSMCKWYCKSSIVII